MIIARCGMKIGLLAMAMMLPACASQANLSQPSSPQAAPNDVAKSATQPLIVAGATMTVEIASVFLAMRDHYPDRKVENGGVINLIRAENPADLATNAETQALRQSVARPDIRIIMTLVEGHYRIVARRSAGINSLADLKGKRIATLRATSADYFMHKMLEKAGLTETDVKVVQIMPLEDLPASFARNEVDAVAIWEPFSENVVRALGNDAVEFSGEGIYRELFNLNTTAGALADPVKRREIVSFLRAIIKANDEMRRDPSEGQALVAASGKYPLEDVVNSWRHHGFNAGFTDNILDVLVDQEIWLAAREKRQPRSREQLAPLIDRSVYEEARATAL